MDNASNENTFDDFPELPRLTPEQYQLVDHMLDTECDTTLDGYPRCAMRYKGVDDWGDVEWMRCTRAAKLRVVIANEGEEPYWALLCYGCCPHQIT